MSDPLASPLQRLLRAVRHAASALAVAGALLLASPGVHVVRAETPERPEARPLSDRLAEDGPMCRAEDVQRRAARRAALADALAARRAEADVGGEGRALNARREGMALNGRGYNYANGRSPLSQLQRVEVEALLESQGLRAQGR